MDGTAGLTETCNIGHGEYTQLSRSQRSAQDVIELLDDDLLAAVDEIEGAHRNKIYKETKCFLTAEQQARIQEKKAQGLLRKHEFDRRSATKPAVACQRSAANDKEQPHRRNFHPEVEQAQ